MTFFPNGPGLAPRILLLGGTSEIGLAILAALDLKADAEVILAGRDEQRLAAAGKELSGQVRTVPYDAAEVGGHQAFTDAIFDEGPLDLVISAAGVLIPQPDLEADIRRAAEMIDANFTGHVTTLLAIAARMRAQGRGTIVVLSSVAAVRPRKANFVYGAAKTGLDAFARGLADSLHGSGVRLLLVRPGFVIGRMTAGMPPAPLATTPAKVGAATAAALRGRKAPVWGPGPGSSAAGCRRPCRPPRWPPPRRRSARPPPPRCAAASPRYGCPPRWPGWRSRSASSPVPPGAMSQGKPCLKIVGTAPGARPPAWGAQGGTGGMVSPRARGVPGGRPTGPAR